MPQWAVFFNSIRFSFSRSRSRLFLFWRWVGLGAKRGAPCFQGSPAHMFLSPNPHPLLLPPSFTTRTHGRRCQSRRCYPNGPTARLPQQATPPPPHSRPLSLHGPLDRMTKKTKRVEALSAPSSCKHVRVTAHIRTINIRGALQNGLPRQLHTAPARRVQYRAPQSHNAVVVGLSDVALGVS